MPCFVTRFCNCKHPHRVGDHSEPHVNPERENLGMHTHLRVAFNVCKCVCCECCGLSLRRGDRVRVSIFQNNLSCFVARSHSPRSDFFLNDGVETGDIFEVFSQSVFLRRTVGNSIFGFETAHMSCTQAYLTNTHSTAHAEFTTELRYVSNKFAHLESQTDYQTNWEDGECLCWSKTAAA